MQAMIEEMRTGQAYTLPKEGMARSKLAAGPTTLEDLVRHNHFACVHCFVCNYVIATDEKGIELNDV